MPPKIAKEISKPFQEKVASELKSDYSNIDSDNDDTNQEIKRENGRTVFDEIMERMFQQEQNFNKGMMEVTASHDSHVQEIKAELFKQETDIKGCL